MKKLSINNKGFSLVELVVSFAILATAAATIMGLMSVGMRFFGRSSSAVSLQYEYQTVMTRLKEYVVDCNAGVAWDDAEDTLYIVYRRPDGSGDFEYQTHVFIFDAADDTLYYKRTGYEGTPPDNAAINAIPDSLVSGNMNAFDVIINSETVKNEAGDEIEMVTTVSPDMAFFSRTRQYRARQDIAMRNKVMTADSYAELQTLLDS